MIETGHGPECVCGHCSAVRKECLWPQPHDPDTGRFAARGERWGHNWLPVRGNLLECDHCGKQAIFAIRHHGEQITTVTLVDAGA